MWEFIFRTLNAWASLAAAQAAKRQARIDESRRALENELAAAEQRKKQQS